MVDLMQKKKPEKKNTIGAIERKKLACQKQK